MTWLSRKADEDSVGFLAEMEIAKSYIGQCVWNRWNSFRTSDKELGWPSRLGRPTQKLLVTRVEWKTQQFGPSFKVWVKTDEAIEGYLDSGGNYFDNRFHLGGQPYFTDSEHFYFEDPRKKFPGWPRAVWDSIMRGEVAIGMTFGMVKLACPRVGIEKIGVVISRPDSSGTGVLYRACGRDFLGVNNKVKKFIK